MEEKLASMDERLAKIEERLQGLIEINNRLVHENIRRSQMLAVTTSAVSSSATSATSATGIVIESHTETTFKVTGKTYPHRNMLREANGEWDKAGMYWIFHNDHKEALIGVCKEAGIEYSHS